MLVPRMSAALQKRHFLSRTRVCDRTEVDLRLQVALPAIRADPRLISEDIVGIVGRVLRRRGRVRRQGLLLHTQGRAVLCCAVQCSAALSAQRSEAQCLANIRVPLSPVPLHRARPCEMHPRLPFQLAQLDALAGLGAIARETGGPSVGQGRGLALMLNGYTHIGVASSPNTTLTDRRSRAIERGSRRSGVTSGTVVVVACGRTPKPSSRREHTASGTADWLSGGLFMLLPIAAATAT